MMSFLILQNIKRFEALLAGSLNPDQRTMVERLLAEEREKLSGPPATPSAEAVTPQKFC